MQNSDNYDTIFKELSHVLRNILIQNGIDGRDYNDVYSRFAEIYGIEPFDTEGFIEGNNKDSIFDYANLVVDYISKGERNNMNKTINENVKRLTSRGIMTMKNENGEKCLALVHRLKPSKNNPKIFDDFYVTPGGGVEEGETIEQTAERELKEELGVDSKYSRVLYTQENETNIHNYVICEYVGGRFGTGTGPEFTDKAYMSKGGKYIPTLIPLREICNINLVPKELKIALANDLVMSKFDIAKIKPRDISVVEKEMEL